MWMSYIPFLLLFKFSETADQWILTKLSQNLTLKFDEEIDRVCNFSQELLKLLKRR